MPHSIPSFVRLERTRALRRTIRNPLPASLAERTIEDLSRLTCLPLFRQALHHKRIGDYYLPKNAGRCLAASLFDRIPGLGKSVPLSGSIMAVGDDDDDTFDIVGMVVKLAAFHPAEDRRLIHSAFYSGLHLPHHGIQSQRAVDRRQQSDRAGQHRAHADLQDCLRA